MRLPSKDSAVASTIRVFLYVVVPQVCLFLLDPDTVELTYEYLPQVAGVITAGAPIITFVYNFLRKDVENY